jgi:PAS domain S-box-containing protein
MVNKTELCASKQEDGVKGMAPNSKSADKRLPGEERAHRIFEAAPNAMLVVREDGSIESVNTAATKLFGYTWDQMVGMNVDQLLPAHLRHAHQHLRQSYLDMPKARPMGQDKALSAIRADGTAFPVEVGLNPIREEDGVSIIVSLIDISARVKAQEEITRLNTELSRRLDVQSTALNQSEKDLRSILDHLPSMIGYWDAQLRNRFGNKAHLDWLGISPKEMPGKHILEVIGQERYELNKPFIDGALAGHEQFFERAIPSPDGSHIRHTQALYLPDIDADGQVLGFYVLVNDVTPIKRAQAHAQELLTFNRAIINSSPVGIAVYKPDGQCLLVNPALARAYGETEDTLIAQNFHHLTAWHNTGLLDDAVKVLRTGKSCERVTVTQTADGQTIYLACSLQPIVRNDQVHLLLIANDITRLEQGNKTISRALDAAHNAAESKSAFLASMSHEIRTPLNAVLGLAQIGERQHAGTQAGNAFQQINESGQHLLALINDVLDFSKIEAGRLEIKADRVHTAHLLQHLSSLTSTRAQAKGLTFSIDESIDFPESFAGDATRITQILINILTNAVKFTPQGHVRLQLSKQSEHLCFKVMDDGPGIATQERTQLFHPFVQINGAHKQAQSGTGLGLAISKRLAELMGGGISLEDDQGHGCVFVFTMPAKDAIKADWSGLQNLTLIGHAAATSTFVEQLKARCDTVSMAPSGFDIPSNMGVNAPILLGPDFITPNHTGTLRKLIHKSHPIIVTGSESDLQQLPSELQNHVQRITTPVTPLRLLDACEAARSQPKDLPPQKRLASIRILAAEDNPVNRLVLEQMLIQEGATVDFGFDGAQALELVNRHGADAYDIVLCDIQMPVMDGFETTLALARIAPDLPVIGLTAHAFETARTHAREVGMVDYVTKPYLLDTLVEVVLKHTKAQTTSQTPDTQSNQDQLKNDPAYPDWVAMQEHFGSNPQLLNKLIQTLREAGRDILTNMDAAMAQRDFAKLKSEAHSLKGAALNLHTPGLAKQAAELQNLAALQAPLAFTLGKEVSAAFSHFLDYLERSPH